MSLYVNNPSLPISADGSNRNKTNRNIQANEVITSNGIFLSRGSSGTNIEIEPSYNYLGCRYVGEFDIELSYNIGDIVTTTDQTYETGTTTPEGTWVCVSPIIQKFTDEDIALYPELARLENIKYAPFLPEPTTLAHEVTDLATQGRYWKQFGGAGGAIKRLRILNVRVDEALECVEEDADGNIPSVLTDVRRIYVAWPSVLRNSSYSLKTENSVTWDTGSTSDETRTGIMDVPLTSPVETTTFDEVIYPEYCYESYYTGSGDPRVKAYSTIYAANATTPITIDAKLYPDRVGEEEESIHISYIDMNVDARSWKPKAAVVNFCINNSPYPGVVIGQLPTVT